MRWYSVVLLILVAGNPQSLFSVASPPNRGQIFIARGLQNEVNGFGSTHCAVSPNEKWMAISDFHNIVHIYQLPQAREAAAWKQDQVVNELAVTPDSRYLLIAENRVKVIEIDSGKTVSEIDGSAPIAISHDGKLLATTTREIQGPVIHLWDIPNSHLVKSAASGLEYVADLFFNPLDDRLLLSGGKTYGKIDSLLQLAVPALSSADQMSLPPDTEKTQIHGDSLLIKTNGLLTVDSLKNGKQLFQIASPKPGEFWSITSSLSEDGRTLLYSSMNEDTIHRVALSSGKETYLKLPPKNDLVANSRGIAQVLTDDVVLTVANSNYQLVDGKTGSLVADMDNVSFFGRRLSVDNDGTYLVVAGGAFDGVRVWDLRRSQPVKAFGSIPFADAGAISANGERLAVSSAEGISVYDPNSQLLVSHLPTRKQYLTLSADASVLAASDDGSPTTLWNVASEQSIQQFEAPEYFNVIPAFSSDGKWVADLGNAKAGGLPGTKPFNDIARAVTQFELTVHDVKTGEVVRSFSLPAKQHLSLQSELLTFTVHDAYLVLASGDELHVWNTKDWTSVGTVQMPGLVNALCASPNDPRVLAVATANGQLGLWDIVAGRLIAEFSGSDPDIRAVAYGPSGEWLVTLPISGQIQFWNVPQRKLLANLLFFRDSEDWLLATPDGQVDGSPAGLKRVYIRSGGTFELASLPQASSSAQLLTKLLPPNSSATPTPAPSLAEATQSKNSKQGTDSRNAPTLQFPQLELQTGNAGNVASVIWGPDKRWIVTLSDDGFMRLWDPRTGHQLRSASASGHEAIGSKDGKWVALSTNQGVRIWDVTHWQPDVLLPPEKSYALAFDVGSSRLLTASWEGELYLWDTNTWRQIAKISPPDRAQGTSAVGLIDGFAVALDKTDCSSSKTGFSCRVSGVRIAHVNDNGSFTDWLKLDNNQIITTLKSGAEGILALSNSGSLFVIDPNKHTIEKTLNLSKPTDGLKMVTSVDGRFVMLLAPFQFSIWDLMNPNQAMISRPTPDVCCSITAGDFADDDTLAVGIDTDLAVVDITPKLKLERRFHGLTDSISSLAFSDDSRWLASALSDRAFREAPTLEADTVRNHAAVRLWSLQRNDANVYRVATHSASSDYALFPSHSDALIFEDGNILTKSDADRDISVLDQPTAPGFWHGGAADPSLSYFAMQGFGGFPSQVVSLAEQSACKLPAPHSMGMDEGLAVSRRYVAATDQKVGAPDETEIGIFRLQDCVKVGQLTSSRSPLGNRAILAFTPDGSTLIAGGSIGVVRWHEQQWLESPKPVAGILGVTTGDPEMIDNTVFPSAMAVNRKGTLLAYGEDYISIFDLVQKKVLRRFSRRTDRITTLTFSSDDRWIAAGGLGGSITLWEVATGRLRATLVPVRESNDWLVVTPDGLFDGTPAAWKTILWRFSNDNFDVSPVEVFFKDFYRPGLLQEILAGRRPTARVDLARVDRRQPTVIFQPPSTTEPSDTPMVHVRMRVSEAPAQEGKPASGVRDVRIFRNGSLAKLWQGQVQLDATGAAELDTDLPIAVGENVFTAFAYTNANIRSSETDASRISVTGSNKLKSTSTAWIIAVGVNHYSDPKLKSLRYAVADADDFATKVAGAQNALRAFQQVNAIELTDQFASRDNVLAVLKRLGGDSSLTPQLPPGAPALRKAGLYDTVFLFFAGHGTSAGDRFYFLTEDTKLNLKTQQIEHGISDVDLADAIQGISAKSFVLVIDACESGSAVGDSNQRIGMTNSAGLAQLAFDKGIDVLTAGSAFQLANEISTLRHGVLTYSLVEKGLDSAADNNPRDGIIDVGEWFTFASQQVPRIILDSRKASVGGPAMGMVQTPRAYYRRDELNLPPVARVDMDQPATKQ